MSALSFALGVEHHELRLDGKPITEVQLVRGVWAVHVGEDWFASEDLREVLAWAIHRSEIAGWHEAETLADAVAREWALRGVSC